MRTFVIGCNHRTAPVEVRERIAFDAPAVPQALQRLGERFPCTETVLVSTCNRMEFYVARPVAGRPRIDEVIDFIGDFHGLGAQEFGAALYSHEDVEAVRHLFRVVSSLDSMVLGESQILAQTKDAFETARTIGTVGKTLGGLFPRAFNVAKDIHTRTTIATGRVSVGSTAVDLARQIFSNLGDKTVMMVGAGKMGELTLTHLLATQPKALRVTNRTDERAVELAERIAARHGVAAEPVPYARWIDTLAEVDIVITSTGSRDPILTAEQFAPIPKRRKYRPLLLIDIAVPRDIAPEVMEVDDSVYLYNIDDLQSVVEKNLAQRRDAIGRCRDIIEGAVLEFVGKQQQQRDLGPVIQELKHHFERIRQVELDWILPKLDSASPHDRALIEQLLHRMTQKVLHQPIQLLSDHTSDGALQVYADTLRAMFQLEPDEETSESQNVEESKSREVETSSADDV